MADKFTLVELHEHQHAEDGENLEPGACCMGRHCEQL